MSHWYINLLISLLLLNIDWQDTLWVLKHDEPLVHQSVDISLITKHSLDHDISLGS